MIPITAIFIVGYGLIKKQKVYEQFIDGAKDGLGTVLSIIPTLIGLMIGVKVISASGLLLWIWKARPIASEYSVSAFMAASSRFSDASAPMRTAQRMSAPVLWPTIFTG